MFLIIMIVTCFYSTNLYTSSSTPPRIRPEKTNEQIPVRKPLSFDNKSTQTTTSNYLNAATTTLHTLRQLTLEESSTSSSIQKSSHIIDATKDSMVTDNVYGAGL